jgi:hypothetical protein
MVLLKEVAVCQHDKHEKKMFRFVLGQSVKKDGVNILRVTVLETTIFMMWPRIKNAIRLFCLLQWFMGLLI